MKRVLLTGGTGFIGSNLARRLLSEGHDLHLLIRPGHEQWRTRDIEPHVEVHLVDLLDRDEVDRAVARVRPEWIFHLAVYGAYSWQQDLDLMQRTNIIGTQGMIEACSRSGFDAFVNAGSSSEYGFVGHPATEEDPPEPNSNYAFTKASSTLFCRYVARRDNLKIPTLRLYSAYGPFEEPRRLLPTIIVTGMEGRLPKLVGREIARDFVYVDDVVSAFLLAASHPLSDPGAIYNVASGHQSSIGDVVALARREFAIEEEPRWKSMEDRAWDTTTWAGKPDKIRRDLGWTPVADLRSGFRSFAVWFRDNPSYKRYYETRLKKRYPE